MPPSLRLIAAVLCAISGFAVILTMGVTPFSGGAILVAFATCGAALGGAVSAPLFGLPGWAGVGWAAVGAISATVLGAAIAGFLFGLLSGDAALGLVFGPATVFDRLASSPAVLCSWLVTMACAYAGAAQARAALRASD